MKNRKSPRMKGYDYASPGGYFVTICTKDREHYFGEVVDGKVVLNELGKHTWKCRNEIPDHYPFVMIDTFICMPNHIHGILVIGERVNITANQSNNIATVGTQYIASSGGLGNTGRSIGTSNPNHTRTDNNPSLQGISPKSGSLGSIVRGFKIGVTKYANQNNIPFARQSRYHDHLIRDQKSYEQIAYYIQTNPEKRGEDGFNE